MTRVGWWMMVILCGALATACTVDRGRSSGALGSIPSDGGYSPPIVYPCEPEGDLPVRITSGAEQQVATATVHIDESGVHIVVNALPGWALGDTYVHIGHHTSFYLFSQNDEPWLTGYIPTIQFDIPLDDLGLACDDVFKLIVQMHVIDTSTWDRYTASAVGTIRLAPTDEGWKSYFTVCCDVEEGCTLTQGYWRNHTDWPVGSLTIGTHNYTQAELLAILDLPSEGDASLILAQQLIAALLNVANGASPIAAIASAQVWMSANGTVLPYGIAPSTPEGGAATALADALADYNEGIDGPGSCPD